jgi:type I restriction enzyme S subunit
MKWADGHCRFPQVIFGRLFTPISRPVRPGAEMVTAYTDGRVTLRSNVRSSGYHESAELSAHQGVEVGDFVVHGLDILRGSVGVSDSTGAISSVCTVCVPRQGVDPRYAAYAIRAEAFSGLPRAMARGVREGGADFRRWDTLRELPIPFPSHDVQQRIADYLDRETARIDAIIAAKRAMIEKITERRRATISQAVSPVPHENGWHMLRLRRLVRAFIDTEHKTAPFYEDGNYLVIRTNNVKDGRLVIGEGSKFTNADGFREWTQRGVPQRGDLLFTREAPAGEACVVPGGLRACVGQRTVLIKVDSQRLLSSYAVWALYGGVSRSFIDQLSQGSTVAHFNMSDIADIPLWVPKLRQQNAIAQSLEQSLGRLDQIISLTELQINQLREHRQALITAAVTGELDVSEVAA